MPNINTYITAADGSSGVRLQLLAGTCDWSFQTLTGTGQGFPLTADAETIWFTNQSPTIYLYGDGTIVYQFYAPTRY
jgi:hypothetical protein